MCSTKFLCSSVLIICFQICLSGCRATPIQTVPEASRSTMEERGGEPIAIRLTQPASVSGLLLPAGSIMRQTSETTCSVFPSETMYISIFPIPAASEIELVQQKRAFVWNGRVKLGDAAVINGISVFAGDRALFTGDLPESPQLMQVQLGNQREVAGNWYPAGSTVHVTPAGAISSVSASMPDDDLAAQQALYMKQKAEREAQCQEICAPHAKDPTTQASCLDYCMNQ